jgi:hypothetical protein
MQCRHDPFRMAGCGMGTLPQLIVKKRFATPQQFGAKILETWSGVAFSPRRRPGWRAESLLQGSTYDAATMLGGALRNGNV